MKYEGTRLLVNMLFKQTCNLHSLKQSPVFLYNPWPSLYFNQ